METGSVHIADSPVMGRLPVLVTATVLAIAGVAQFVDDIGSTVLAEWGGEVLNTAWASAALIAWSMVAGARMLARVPQSAAVLEIGGIVLMFVCLTIYIFAVVYQRGLVGNAIPLGVCAATALNILGRAVLLWRRRTWVRRIAG